MVDFPLSTATFPAWAAGYVPPADEWNSWFSKKVDVGDAALVGGPFLPIVGGELTGPLTLYGPPILPLDAATKAYVDAITPEAGPFMSQAGGTFTGPVFTTSYFRLVGNPVNALDATPKQYVDAASAQAASAQATANAAVRRTGDTMTGPLVLSGDPGLPLGAATKQYADTKLGLTGGVLAGGLTMTGDLTASRVLAGTAFFASAFNGYEWAFLVDPSNGNKLQQYRAGWFDLWQGTTGNRYWEGPSGILMWLSGAGQLSVTNGLIVSGVGIAYPNYGTHIFGFQWDGTFIDGVVDGTSVGQLANVGWALATFFPKAGGTFTGAVTVNGNFAVLGSAGFNSGVSVAGNLSSATAVLAPVIAGGPANAGTLRTYADTNFINFRWDGTTTFYRISEAVEHGICTSVNASVLSVVSLLTSPTGAALQLGDGPNTTRGSIYFDVWSDARIKENIEDTDVDALDLLSRIPMHQFDVKAPYGRAIARMGGAAEPGSPHVRLGMVAQEVGALIPEAMAVVQQPEGSELDVKDIHYIGNNMLVPYLIKAVQQLSAKLEAHGIT